MRLFISTLILLALASCNKDSDAPNTVLNEQPSTNVSSMQLGYFQNGPYGSVSGRATVSKITEASYEVVLDSFMTTNGPDLYVYLSKEIMPVSFIEIGKLKSTSGRQVYPFNMPQDLASYKYVCIHCKAYNHLFGSALIK